MKVIPTLVNWLVHCKFPNSDQLGNLVLCIFYVTPQGAEYPVLAGQYVCVGVYQRAHEESHGRETTGTISGM